MSVGLILQKMCQWIREPLGESPKGSSLFVVIVSGCGKDSGEDVETIPSLTIPVTVDSSAPATSSKRPSAQVLVEDEVPSDEAVATSTTRAAAVTVAVSSRFPIDAEVLVVGDSLIVESQDVTRERLPGSIIVARTGAAPCSMIDEATAAASSADVVVLAFSGNGSFLAPCMAGRDDDLGAAYRESYEDYASAIGVDRLRMTMTPVWGGPQLFFVHGKDDGMVTPRMAAASARRYGSGSSAWLSSGNHLDAPFLNDAAALISAVG